LNNGLKKPDNCFQRRKGLSAKLEECVPSNVQALRFRRESSGVSVHVYVDGKQKSHNVPRHKVAPLKEALENGRRIERLMVRNALAMIQTDRGRKKR